MLPVYAGCSSFFSTRDSYQSAPLKAMLELFRTEIPKLYGI